MSDESRAALEEAWDAAEAEGDEPETEEVSAPVDEETTEEPVAEDETSTKDPVDGGEPDGTENSPVDGEEDDAGEEPLAAKASDEPGRVDDGPGVKAPASWTPQARETWNDIPEEARSAILERDKEVNRVLEESAADRREMQRLQQAVKPFEQTLAIEAGGDPIAATQNLLGVATRLRFGTPVEKAQLVSQLVNDYGVDVEALDNALASAVTQPGAGAGYPPPGVPNPAPVAADPRVDQMWNAQQSQQNQIIEDNRKAAETFLTDPKNEFAMDVRQDMADLMEVAFKRGQHLTMEQAYERACAVNPSVRAVIAQRGGNPAAGAPGNGAPAADLRQKKRAAKSVKGSPSAGESKREPQTREEQLAAAWDAHANNG